MFCDCTGLPPGELIRSTTPCVLLSLNAACSEFATFSELADCIGTIITVAKKRELHPEIRKYLDKRRFKKFTVDRGHLHWDDYELIFPIADLYAGRIS